MICPKCGGKTTVNESARDKDYVYRKRVCTKCGNVIFTEEAESCDATYTRYMLTKTKNMIYAKDEKTNGTKGKIRYKGNDAKESI